MLDDIKKLRNIAATAIITAVVFFIAFVMAKRETNTCPDTLVYIDSIKKLNAINKTLWEISSAEHLENDSLEHEIDARVAQRTMKKAIQEYSLSLELEDPDKAIYWGDFIKSQYERCEKYDSVAEWNYKLSYIMLNKAKKKYRY